MQVLLLLSWLPILLRLLLCGMLFCGMLLCSRLLPNCRLLLLPPAGLLLRRLLLLEVGDNAALLAPLPPPLAFSFQCRQAAKLGQGSTLQILLQTAAGRLICCTARLACASAGTQVDSPCWHRPKAQLATCAIG